MAACLKLFLLSVLKLRMREQGFFKKTRKAMLLEHKNIDQQLPRGNLFTLWTRKICWIGSCPNHPSLVTLALKDPFLEVFLEPMPYMNFSNCKGKSRKV